MHSLTETEVGRVLRVHNPGVAPRALGEMAKILARVGSIIAALPGESRRDIAQSDEQPLREALLRLARAGAAHIEPSRSERREGTGLGARISVEEGRARLDSYAQVRPIESWAGRVAGAGEIEREFGIARSTLARWQQRGAVVGLLRGERKFAYPVEQFLDGRPLGGIGDVVKCIGDQRAAWLWLRQPHAAFDARSPLSELHTAGGRERVTQAANRDFS